MAGRLIRRSSSERGRLKCLRLACCIPEEEVEKLTVGVQGGFSGLGGAVCFARLGDCCRRNGIGGSLESG